MKPLFFQAIPAFLLLAGLELLLLRHMGRRYHREDAFASLALGVGNVFISGSCKAGWVLVYIWAHDFRAFTMPSDAWWSWTLLILGQDFLFYWYHRFSHRVRAGWAAHVSHHSSESFNLTTALRQSWTSPLYSFGFFVPLAFLGYPPAMLLASITISALYQFWLHTETIGRLGPLEWFMNTPSHHRVHHGANPQYIDRNYGGIFIIYDRLFGTFVQEGEKVRYGLTTNIHSYNPLWIAFHDWVGLGRDMLAARNLWDALRRPFAPPDRSFERAEDAASPAVPHAQ